MRRSRGFRNKTRRLFRHKVKTTITEKMRKFNIDDKVIIKINSSMQKATPHPRYYGVCGSIIGKRGRAYIVRIKDKNKPKKLISSTAHLKPLLNN